MDCRAQHSCNRRQDASAAGNRTWDSYLSGWETGAESRDACRWDIVRKHCLELGAIADSDGDLASAERRIDWDRQVVVDVDVRCMNEILKGRYVVAEVL